MNRPHRFVRKSVAFAREKVQQGEWQYRLPEPGDVKDMIQYRPGASPVDYCPAPAWTVGSILVKDHEELEQAANKILAALQLLDDMTMECPVCGGKKIDFGPVTAIVEAQLGVQLLTTHTPTCPLLEAWQGVARRIHGEMAADGLNKLGMRDTPDAP